ncbi:hypothetical protein HDIA_4058 [Hartmannibacter diazotrophicus]|uniref:DUF1653 domain-containing protein n=1 Tax=Hartmannibacter diazotrophicus TaxID=1482074 RepID=A0A2C9DBP9_9HYPH|nr:DUF1653 domain-containing protein [Hartmannibacter diazotrophicus]SON57599.1 hypothetical protein HDIA_4058 [Hartmannibacter diazotrophicus]
MMELDQETEAGPPVGTIWLHKKSGGIYAVVGSCRIEATREAGVLYHATDGTGPVWCRSVAEFLDGRFRLVKLDLEAARAEA